MKAIFLVIIISFFGSFSALGQNESDVAEKAYKECADLHKSDYFRRTCVEKECEEHFADSDLINKCQKKARGLVAIGPSSSSANSKDSDKEEVFKITLPDNGKWDIQRSSSAMDDSKKFTMWLDAENSITGWPDKNVVPTLYIRCRENTTNLFIDLGMSANPEVGNYNRATVRIRLDEGKPFKQNWSESTDNEALFAPKAIALSKQINKSKKMLFEFIPFNSSTQLVEFDVRGAKEFLSELAKTCNWSL